MAYRHDSDLVFLSQVSTADLDDLVCCLTHDKKGQSRWTEMLTGSKKYKAYHPDHAKYWDDIASEIQCFGANSLTTLLRQGKGVLYREILSDVCDKLKVNYNKKSSVEKIESNLLMKILNDAIEKMSADEIRQLGTELGIQNASTLTPQMLSASFQAIFKAGGFKSYQLTIIIVNAVLKALLGRGLPFVVAGPLMKYMAILTGPIGWALTSAWTAVSIAGPAYRVTIPIVIQIAFLRQKLALGMVENLDVNNEDLEMGYLVRADL